MARNFAAQERRKNIRQVNLPRVAEISARQFKILSHHGELEPLGAQHLAYLAQNFVNPA